MRIVLEMFLLHFLRVRRLAAVTVLASVLFGFISIVALPEAKAASASEINTRTNSALVVFREKVKGADSVLAKAKGVLVFPRVLKAGIGVGGEYGEGVLRINGKTVDYYNTIAASYGLQLGAQKKSIIILFMEDSALAKFRNSQGWKIGGDASVALVKLGAAGSIDSATLNKPIIAFVVGQKGLMYNLSLEGTKITKIKK